MEREEIANQNIEAYEGLGRVIKLQSLFFDLDLYKEDTLLTLRKATSFAGQDANAEFTPETSLDGELVTVVFNCEGAVKAHKVNYQDKDEVEVLSAVEGEDEYLVPAGTHFQISDSSNADDIEEMGYCEVNIYQLKEEEYKEAKDYGANEIFDI